MQEVQHDEFKHKSHKVQQRIEHELPLNYFFMIFLASLSPPLASIAKKIHQSSIGGGGDGGW